MAEEKKLPAETRETRFRTWKEFDRLFSMMRGNLEEMFGGPSAGIEEFYMPKVDLEDAGKEFLLKADVPGFEKEDVRIQMDENSVTISAETESEKKKEGKNFIHRERGYKSFCRTVALPEQTDPHKSEAQLKKGVLKIRMAKTKPKEKFRIDVKD